MILLQLMMLLAPLASVPAPVPVAVPVPVPVIGQGDDPAVLAYRAGDWALAEAEWSAALEAAEHPNERARIAYDLGNVAFRQDQTLRAVAWYTAALRCKPRDADTWANLELARSEAGLEPADRGDLTDTLERLVSSTTLIESEWGVLFALLVLAGCLLGEALRGGVFWRRLCLCSGGLVLVAAVPLGWNLDSANDAALMVVSERAAAARSEPRPDATRLTELEPGSIVERLDELPGWIQVRDPEGKVVWVRDHALFDLTLGGAGEPR